MEGLLTILIFVGVISLTALIFGIWIVTALARAIFRGFFAIFTPQRELEAPPTAPTSVATRGIVCTNARCRATNPETARFCRRCGSALPQAERVNVRRVALW